MAHRLRTTALGSPNEISGKDLRYHLLHLTHLTNVEINAQEVEYLSLAL